MFILNMPFCQNTDITGQICFKNEKKCATKIIY